MNGTTSLRSLKRIYYRGKLSSCNYTCSYCPFGKKTHSLASIAEDERAWKRFITAIEQWEGEALQLFIIPYGEALVHRYYREGIARLAAMPQVAGISCQTNLSFPSRQWLDELRSASAYIHKIKVWGSFHPEMTTVDKFVGQLHLLHQAGMDVCAGAVGNPSAKDTLSDLRDALSPDIYLFVNAMQGLRKTLGEEDVRFFSQLDNLFEYDLRNAQAQWEACAGGKTSCFVDWKGDMFACPRSQVRIGNFYREMEPVASLPCKRKVCDCYIAFSNLTNHPLQSFMGAGAFWRIPDRPLIKAIFFDIDGTLTNAQGHVPPGYAKAIRQMAQSTTLLLATSLSPEQARRKLGRGLFDLFKGGIFADGGLLSFENQVKYLPIRALVCEEAVKTTSFTYQGQAYKYSMLVPDKEARDKVLARLKAGSYHLFQKGPLLTITHPEASKKEGVRQVCEALKLPLTEVLIVGNSLDDWPMMSLVPHSCAVMDAEPLLKELARYTLNPNRLPAFFRFHP